MVISAANEKLPFLWDLVLADAKVEYQVIQTNGVLSLHQPALIPPTAVIAFPDIPQGAPLEVLVNTPLTLDASGSFDDQDTAELLSVRWDFNSDGIFDTDWSTTKTQTVSYPNVGSYTIKLEVRDLDGLIGQDVRFVYVRSDSAQGTASHIVVFRDYLPWDSYAFENMMTALHYTEGEGERQYSIIPSSEMANIILRPGTDLVLITNDQNQTFYNNLAGSMDRFLRFLENGGTVLWGACDEGWAGGSMQAAGITLPGGVVSSWYYDPTNYVVLPDAPLMI